MTDPIWPLAALAGAAGILFGWLYFAVLARALRNQLEGGPLGRSLGLLALRIALAVGLFLAAARLGAAPLIAALLGFLLARHLAVRRAGAW